MGNNPGKGKAGVASEQNVEPEERTNEVTATSPVSKKSSHHQQPKSKKQSKHVVERPDTPAIPKDQFNKFLNCLKDMPFEINENEFQNIAARLKTVEFAWGETVLQKGTPGKGIYLVVNGYCNVVTDSDDVLRVIRDEDYFGELSSFYGKPCSATVISGENGSELLWLPENVLGDIISTNVDFPLIDWYVKRRYIDFDSVSRKDEIMKRTVKDAMKHAGPFHCWSADAIDAVAEHVIAEGGIICYPAGSEIFASGETDTNGWLLINGDIEPLSETQQSLEIVNAGPTGLWFGDEQLFCFTERQISAKAQTPCIVAVFNADKFQDISERFPIEQAKLIEISLSWKRFIENQDKKLHDKYAGQLGADMTQLVLRKSSLLSLAPPGMTYRIALCLIHRRLQKDELVYKDKEVQDKMFVVFSGVIIVESDSTVSCKEFGVSNFYYPTDIEPDDVIARAQEESIVGMIDILSFKAVQDLYPEGIVNWDRTVNIVGHC